MALRVIGSDVTVAAADDLANRPDILATLDLHQSLRMICIENNSMSDQLRNQFVRLKGMSVFVEETADYLRQLYCLT